MLQVSTERGGGVTPGRDNRITESATKESREAKPETKEVIQDTNGKQEDESTKRTKIEQGRKTRRTIRRGNTKRKKNQKVRSKSKGV